MQTTITRENITDIAATINAAAESGRVTVNGDLVLGYEAAKVGSGNTLYVRVAHKGRPRMAFFKPGVKVDIQA